MSSLASQGSRPPGRGGKPWWSWRGFAPVVPGALPRESVRKSPGVPSRLGAERPRWGRAPQEVHTALALGEGSRYTGGMAKITLKGNPIETRGSLPAPGSVAPDATLTGMDLADKKLSAIPGKRVLNIFPSIDTGVCAASVRTFNQRAAEKPGVTVLNVSLDLPFALKRFCGAEGIDKVQSFSCFRGDFGEQFGVTIQTGGLAGLYSRAVIVLDEGGKVLHAEQVPEIGQEPNYDAALKAL